MGDQSARGPADEIIEVGGPEASGPTPDARSRNPIDETAQHVEPLRPDLQGVLRLDPPPPHPDRVRMHLAWAMVVILGGVVLVACWGWLAGADVRRMQGLALIMSPVVTLVGTILGFYFSSERQDRTSSR